MLSSKDILREFWDEFGVKKNSGVGFTSEKKLEALRGMTTKIPTDRRKYNQREKFDRIKFQRHNLKTHDLCFVCQVKAEIRHHIITIKNGGHNGKRNLVSLCKQCHAEVHPWLK